MDTEIISAATVGTEITQLILPFVAALISLVVTLSFKDYATKIAKGLAFQMNRDFQEGDKVILLELPNTKVSSTAIIAGVMFQMNVFLI